MHGNIHRHFLERFEHIFLDFFSIYLNVDFFISLFLHFVKSQSWYIIYSVVYKFDKINEDFSLKKEHISQKYRLIFILHSKLFVQLPDIMKKWSFAAWKYQYAQHGCIITYWIRIELTRLCFNVHLSSID